MAKRKPKTDDDAVAPASATETTTAEAVPGLTFVARVIQWAVTMPRAHAARREAEATMQEVQDYNACHAVPMSERFVDEIRLTFARRWAGTWRAETRGTVDDYAGVFHATLDSAGVLLEPDPAEPAGALFGADTVERVTTEARTVDVADIEPPVATATVSSAASIATLGFNSTPILSPTTTAERAAGVPYMWRVVDGERRVTEAIRLRLTSIPALCADRPMGRSTQAAVRLGMNLGRSDNPFREAEAIAELEGQHTDAVLASMLGVSRQTLDNRRRLLRLPAEVRAAVATGKVKPTAAARMATLSDTKMAEALDILARTGTLTMADVKSLTRAAREDAVADLPAGLFDALEGVGSAPVRRPEQGFLDAAAALVTDGWTVEQLAATLTAALGGASHLTD